MAKFRTCALDTECRRLMVISQLSCARKLSIASLSIGFHSSYCGFPHFSSQNSFVAVCVGIAVADEMEMETYVASNSHHIQIHGKPPNSCSHWRRVCLLPKQIFAKGECVRACVCVSFGKVGFVGFHELACSEWFHLSTRDGVTGLRFNDA